MPFRVFLLALLLSAGLYAQGRRAPGFSLPDSKNQQHDLTDYRGKIVLLDFMKTDCPHCITFAPILEQAKNRYTDQVVVLSIVMGEAPPAVNQFIATHKITVPVLFDCGQVAFSYILPNPKAPAITLPHLYIIGRDGMILRDHAHQPSTKEIFSGKELFAELDRLVGPRPIKKY